MSIRNEPETTKHTEYGAVYTRRYATHGETVTERLYVGPWTHRYATNFVKRTNKADPTADARLVTRTVRTETTAWS